jgi:hypothetical protein
VLRSRFCSPFHQEGVCHVSDPDSRFYHEPAALDWAPMNVRCPVGSRCGFLRSAPGQMPQMSSGSDSIAVGAWGLAVVGTPMVSAEQFSGIACGVVTAWVLVGHAQVELG